MDYNETVVALKKILSSSTMSAQVRMLHLFMTVRQACIDTKDVPWFDKKSCEIINKVSLAHGSIENLCNDVLIPTLIDALMFKYLRMDVVKLLHDSFFHNSVPPPPRPRAPSLLLPPPPPSTLPPGVFENDADKCIVCLEKIRTRMCVPCGHVCMCADCASAWIRKKATCPMCRAQVTSTTEVTQSELDQLLDKKGGAVYSDPRKGPPIQMYASRFENRVNRVTCTSDLHSLLLDLQEITGDQVRSS